MTKGFERFLNTQRGGLRDISVELSQKQQLESENTAPVIEKKTLQLQEEIMITCESSHRLKNKELQNDGVSKRKIAKKLKMSRNTINRYWNRTSFLPK